MLAEGVDGQAIERLGQDAAADQRVGYVEGDALVGPQVVRLQIGDQRRQPLGLHALAFRDRDVGIDLVGRIEARADDEDGDLADVVRQGRVRGHRQGQVPDRLADGRLVQPRVPRTHQRAVFPLDLEGVEVAGDALSHLVVEGLLLGRQLGWGDQGQAHPLFLSRAHDAGAAWLIPETERCP